MGKRNRGLINGPSLFFVTATTIEHYNYFDNDFRLQIASESMREVFSTKHIRLNAYVIMSNHIHFLAYFEEGGRQLSGFMISLKGIIRHRIVGNSKIWEKRFDDEVIKTEQMLRNTINYIHWNPVKAGLVETPEDYPYSSARIWAGMESDSRISTDLLMLSTTEG